MSKTDKMLNAYVLLWTEMGKEDDVLDEVKNVKNVVEAYKLYGQYDIGMKISAEDEANLKNIVIYNLRKIPGVRGTVTLIIS